MASLASFASFKNKLPQRLVSRMVGQFQAATILVVKIQVHLWVDPGRGLQARSVSNKMKCEPPSYSFKLNIPKNLWNFENTYPEKYPEKNRVLWNSFNIRFFEIRQAPKPFANRPNHRRVRRRNQRSILMENDGIERWLKKQSLMVMMTIRRWRWWRWWRWRRRRWRWIRWWGQQWWSTTMIYKGQRWWCRCNEGDGEHHDHADGMLVVAWLGWWQSWHFITLRQAFPVIAQQQSFGHTYLTYLITYYVPRTATRNPFIRNRLPLQQQSCRAGATMMPPHCVSLDVMNAAYWRSW